MPDWFEKQPPYVRGDSFYMKGFWELSSERQFGQCIGPIPWSSIVSYAHLKQLDAPMTEVFTEVMRSLDEAYLKWQRNDQDRRTEQTRPAVKEDG